MSKPIRLGVLGCAKIVRDAVVRACNEVPEVELVAISSRRQAEADAYAARFQIPMAYGSYEALLADPGIDVVYNPLPNHLHHQWTIAILESGKHALVEKPMCANRHEATQMVSFASESGKHLIEAFHYRYHPFCQTLKQRIDAGEIGRLKAIDVTIKTPSSLLEQDDIRLRYECAGGATMDLGSYAINLVRHLTGEEPSVTFARPQLAGEQIDAAMDFGLEFPNGISATVACSIQHDKVESRVMIHGDTGSFEAKNLFLPQFGNSLTLRRDGTETKERFDRTTTYACQLRSLADVLATGHCLTPGEDGIANMTVIDLVYEAAEMQIRGV